MNMQYTIKTKDIQNKGEGKGLMDNAASELMAISMYICFARSNMI